MFVLAEDDRWQIKQYAAWCMACFFAQPGESGPGTAPPAQGGLSEKLGVFVKFAVAGKTLYATGVFLPAGPLSHSLEMVYKRAASVVQSEKGGAAAALTIVSQPQLCVNIDSIDLDRHGILLFARGRSHYLLPGAAFSQGLSKIGALERLCRCLSLPPGTWRDRTARIMTFETADL